MDRLILWQAGGSPVDLEVVFYESKNSHKPASIVAIYPTRTSLYWSQCKLFFKRLFATILGRSAAFAAGSKLSRSTTYAGGSGLAEVCGFQPKHSGRFLPYRINLRQICASCRDH